MDARIPALAAVLVLAVARPLHAEEPPAPKAAAPLEKDLAAARVLLKDGRWKAARDALLKLFADRLRDPDVLRRLADIEEDLKLASFRAQEPEPTAEALFGKGAVKFMPMSRRVWFEFPEGPAAPTWSVVENTLALLLVHFDEVSISYGGKTSFETLLFVAYDADRKTGCLVAPGTRIEDRYRDTTIHFVAGDESRELGLTLDKQLGRFDFTVSVKPGQITWHAAKAPRPEVARSPKIGTGIVAIRGALDASCRIEGVVQKSQVQAAVGAHYDRRFREWCRDRWRREEVLPEWAVAPPAVTRSAVAPDPLPADAPSPAPVRILRSLELWHRGEVKSFLASLPELDDVGANTRSYLRGLFALGEGRIADADTLFTAAIDGDGAFPPALVYRGIARLRLRNLAAAKADFLRALESGAALPDASIGIAHLAIVEGDLTAADDHLADARARGVVSPALDLLATRVLHSRRGPSWSKRFEVKGPAALVATDHSQDMAQQVSRIVEGTLSLGTAIFPDTVRATAPIRVQVFSSREGYLAYCADLGHSVAKTLGVYIPAVRELVLYVPDVGREGLWTTARHEAFHAFLHGSIEAAPLWFNEGWAECFAYGKPVAGGIALTHPGREALAQVGTGTIRAEDVEALLVMEPARFMADAERNYVLSRALVQFLYDGKNRRYRPALTDYFRALRAGLSPEAAFGKHLKPVLADIAVDFRGW